MALLVFLDDNHANDIFGTMKIGYCSLRSLLPNVCKRKTPRPNDCLCGEPSLGRSARVVFLLSRLSNELWSQETTITY